MAVSEVNQAVDREIEQDDRSELYDRVRRVHAFRGVPVRKPRA
jgi:hypothetical protein